MLTTDDEIVAVMDGQRGGGAGDRAAEERRRAAVMAFLGTGMTSPPSTALLAAALAGARRAVALHRARGLAVDQWPAGEVRLWGIRENAAVLEVLETPGWQEIAQAYRQVTARVIAWAFAARWTLQRHGLVVLTVRVAVQPRPSGAGQAPSAPSWRRRLRLSVLTHSSAIRPSSSKRKMFMRSMTTRAPVGSRRPAGDCVNGARTFLRSRSGRRCTGPRR